MEEGYKICKNCIMDSSDSMITFDEEGFCDYCTGFQNEILPDWDTGEKGRRSLEESAKKIRNAGRGKPYDCIIGLSGGTDSSYLTHIATQLMGLRPLIYVMDTGWNLNVANDNIKCLVDALGLTMVVEKADWDEMKDFQLAFFKSNVPYQDTPQDHVIFAGLYNYAARYGIKYVLTGGNYATECVKPPYEWTYLNDMHFIKGIQKKHGTMRLKKLPMCSMFKYRLYYRYVKGIRVVKPLNYVPYEKKEAEALLSKEYGWKKYENKHYENVFTRFFEGYYLPQKFGYDKRRAYFSSQILTGQMSREDALKKIEEQPYSQALKKNDIAYISEKLGISTDELNGYVTGEKRAFRDYPNSYWLIRFAIKLAKLTGIEKRNFR